MSIDRVLQMALRSLFNAYAHRLSTRTLIILIVAVLVLLFFGAYLLEFLPFSIVMK
ncbi:hypothetical protein [Thiomicrospira microaerophila]|uniref:hypothetical protein n=1 Tax=Thiomicrospira microaerophila TaxID=406020 RepID=UPI0012FD1CE3|nr:hypothetical protein [Thiomicrospira microaerophila]